MTKITSNEQARRTVQALAETTGLIAKERAYRPDLQHAGYLAMLEEHAEKLLRMIEEYKQRTQKAALAFPQDEALRSRYEKTLAHKARR